MGKTYRNGAPSFHSQSNFRYAVNRAYRKADQNKKALLEEQMKSSEKYSSHELSHKQRKKLEKKHKKGGEYYEQECY